MCPFPRSLFTRALPPRARGAAPTRPHRTRLRLESLEDRTTPAVHAWTGLGADNLWSDSQNWTNGTPASDLSGNVDLVFHTNLINTANLVTQNDLTGLVIDSITFDANPGVAGVTLFAAGGTTANGYTINGNTISLSTTGLGGDFYRLSLLDGVASPGYVTTVNVNLTLSGAFGDFLIRDAEAQINFGTPGVAGTGNISINTPFGFGLEVRNQQLTPSNPTVAGVNVYGVISGAGDLRKSGVGSLQLAGANTYTGKTTVSDGELVVTNGSALGAPTNTTTIDNLTDHGVLLVRGGISVTQAVFNLDGNDVGGVVRADGGATATLIGTDPDGGFALNSARRSLATSFGAAGAGTRLVLRGVISGLNQSLFVDVQDRATVEFARDNTYAGATVVTSSAGTGGFLQMDSPRALGDTASGSNTAVGSGTTLLFNGNFTLAPETIVLSGGGVDGRGALRTLGNSNVTVPGEVTLAPGAPWSVGVDSTLGSLTLTGSLHSLTSALGLTKVGPGRLVFAGNLDLTDYTGPTTVNEGALVVLSDARGPAVQVNAGGALSGTQDFPLVSPRTGAVTSTGGTVAPGFGPGFSPGFLGVVGDLTLDSASTYRVDLNGTLSTPFDQLFVTGAVNLGRAALQVNLGPAPAVGDSYRVIANDGTDAVVGTFAGLPEGGTLDAGGTRFAISYAGGDGNDVVLTALGPSPTAPPPVTPPPPSTPPVVPSPPTPPVIPPAPTPAPPPAYYAVSAAGVASVVAVFDARTGALVRVFEAFPGFAGGVSVATADVTGDAVPDVIAGTAGVGSFVAVYDGATGALVRVFEAFPGFAGGVRVAAADINRDGFADYVVGAASRSSLVVLFDGRTGALVGGGAAFPGFAGGVNVATGDVTGDGTPDVIVGTATGASHVQVFDGACGRLVQSFLAYGSFGGGVTVAAGDLNGDGRAEVIVGAASLVPQVTAFDGATGRVLRSFLVRPGAAAGVTVAARDITGDNVADIVTGVGSAVVAFDGLSLAPVLGFFPFGPVPVGVFVG